jgi:hypothetical protein
MKSSIGAAAFGVAPRPPMPGTSAQVERPAHEAMERIATKDEIARLRRELGIDVERPAD